MATTHPPIPEKMVIILDPRRRARMKQLADADGLTPTAMGRQVLSRWVDGEDLPRPVLEDDAMPP